NAGRNTRVSTRMAGPLHPGRVARKPAMTSDDLDPLPVATRQTARVTAVMAQVSSTLASATRNLAATSAPLVIGRMATNVSNPRSIIHGGRSLPRPLPTAPANTIGRPRKAPRKGGSVSQSARRGADNQSPAYKYNMRTKPVQAGRLQP